MPLVGRLHGPHIRHLLRRELAARVLGLRGPVQRGMRLHPTFPRGLQWKRDGAACGRPATAVAAHSAAAEPAAAVAAQSTAAEPAAAEPTASEPATTTGTTPALAASSEPTTS